jgi:hypothetical protein
VRNAHDCAHPGQGASGRAEGVRQGPSRLWPWESVCHSVEEGNKFKDPKAVCNRCRRLMGYAYSLETGSHMRLRSYAPCIPSFP